MTKLLFATNNAHKIEEIRSAIGHLVHVIGLKEAGIDIDIPEPHPTIRENASEKSSVVFARTGISCFSEDTGLEIDALNGDPGVRSARYAGGWYSERRVTLGRVGSAALSSGDIGTAVVLHRAPGPETFGGKACSRKF